MFQAGSKILITGITGVVGGSLAIHALKNGCRLVAFMRDLSVSQARQRLKDMLLQEVGSLDFLHRIDILLGDLRHPELGILSGAYHLQNISGILHCAASVDFQDRSKPLVVETNIQGTQRILELADCLRVPLVYISTAYVCGNRTGLIGENEIFTGQRFHNAYEESKCEAEWQVRQWSKTRKSPVFILRPSIVVGHSQTGRISCFNTVYQFMQVFQSLTRNGKQRTLRIMADPASALNLIPLDGFTKTAWAILQAGQSGAYHVTHPQGITIGELGRLFQTMFPGLCIEFIDRFPPGFALSREESFFHKAISHYLPYMSNGPVFDLSNTLDIFPKHATETLVLDLSLFQRLYRYAAEVDFGKSKSASNINLSTMPSLLVQDYFNRFLTEKLRQRLLPNLRKLTAQFRIVLYESSHIHWALRIDEGVLTGLSQSDLPPQCSFVLSESTFLEIISGRLSPQYAFFKRLIEIQGDLEKGLGLAAVLSDFFILYPFPAGAHS